jgi:hypothetical protein
MPMPVSNDVTLYSRPLIVFLAILIILLVAFNYIPLIAAQMKNEGFETYPSTVCPAVTNASYTTQDVMIPYDNTILPKPAEIVRTADGILTDQALKAYMERLQKEKRIPADGAMANAEQVSAIAGEFCYINARYEYCIKKFFDGAYKTGSGNDATQFETWLENARRLAMNLVDILTLLTIIKSANINVFASTSTADNMTAMTQRIDTLLKHRADMSDPDSAAKLYTKMVEYTKEKNRANNNLIALYSFLNLVALGMLFYVYRAS